MSSGARIIGSYLLISYILPLAINLRYDTRPLFRTPLDVERVLVWLILFIFAGMLAILAARITPRVAPRLKGPLKPIPYSIAASFTAASLAIGLYTLNSSLSQWRYAGSSIAQSPNLIIISLVQMLLPVMIFWMVITDQKLLKSRTPKALLLRVALVLSLLVSINGLGTALNAFFLALLLAFPGYTLPFVIDSDDEVRRGKSVKITKFLAVGALGFLLAQPIFLFGVQAKSGRDSDVEEATQAYVALSYLVNRHSVHMASAAAAIEDGYNLENIMIVPNALSFRLGLLLGLSDSTDKPKVQSYSRQSLVQFANFKNINKRGGSSPGALATFAMSFPIGIALASFFLYCFVLVKVLDFMFGHQPRLTWIGAMAFAYFPMRTITDSPADLILPGPPLLLIFILVILASRRDFAKHRLSTL